MNISAKHIVLSATAVVLAAVTARAGEVSTLGEWRFSREGAAWQDVAVPHDWAISGPFDKAIDLQTVAIEQNGEKVATEKTGRSGSLPWIGEGRYEREVVLPDGIGYASLVFEGAMSEAHVLWDGKEIAFHPYGYSVFEVALPPDPGAHRLEVRLSNVPESSRWYPGAGLYRPVRLFTAGKTHIPYYGQNIETRSISPSGDMADVVVETEVTVDDADLLMWLYDAEGRLAGHAVELSPGRKGSMLLRVPSPRLWTPETPHVYRLVTEVRIKSGEIVDRHEERFGIRMVKVDTEGFKLNGKTRKIKGVCLHHDLGPLGAAFNAAAFRRQLRKLKEIGCDAVRFSHNMPAPDQLAICDEMGMMAMAESFDSWEWPKCKNGYNRFFKEWWPRDLESLVKSCRNHPSVVMWSIGNEVPEQSSEKGFGYTKAMQDYIHSLDTTRPVTQGLDRWPGPIKSGVAGIMDVCGLNYRLKYYGAAREAAKGNVVLGSETSSTFSSRGVYHFPVTVMKTNDNPHPDGQCSSYDVECATWSNLPEGDRVMQEDNDWVMGEFVWTGFDYLGEPSPYDSYWPSRSSYFGIFDLAGLAKDRAYLYRSYWLPEAPTLHIVPHWTWPGREGETTPVYVYTDADEAELFVNGKSQGKRKKQNTKDAGKFGEKALDRFRLRWNDVVYEPGELKVVTADGREAKVCTAGEPDHLKLEVEPADERDDLRFVVVTVVDKNGNECPTAAEELSFETTGDVKFRAVCNGDPTSLEVFTEPHMKTFSGKLAVVLETGVQPRGSLVVTNKNTGCKSAVSLASPKGASRD